MSLIHGWLVPVCFPQAPEANASATETIRLKTWLVYESKTKTALNPPYISPVFTEVFQCLFWVFFVSFLLESFRLLRGFLTSSFFPGLCLKFSLLHVVPTDACRGGSKETRSQFYLLYGVHQSYNTNILTEFDIHKRTLYTRDVSGIKMIKNNKKKTTTKQKLSSVFCWRTWIKLVFAFIWSVTVPCQQT